MPDPRDSFRPRLVEPGEYPAWDRALALVNRDLAATLPDEPPLRLRALPPWEEGEPENVHVARANGEWHGNNLWPESSQDDAAALAAVAGAAQDTVMELLWQAWPVCAEHGLGMHPGEAEGRWAWWCAGGGRPGDGEHVRAPVGALDTLVRPHRPHRKKRRPEARR